MKQNRNQMVYAMATLGAVLLALRLRLYIVALDEKNLLVRGHWICYVIWAAAALCIGLALTEALRTQEKRALSVGGPVAALGDGLFAVAICLSVLAMGEPVSVLKKVYMVLGYLCAAGLLYSAFCRATGKPVFFGCFCLICGFFALYLVDIYRVWSSSPQLQDYVFALAALVGVTLFAYQNAALAVGIGSRRVWLASGLLTISFGLGAVCRAEPMLLYIGAAGWTLTGILGEQKREEP